MKKITKMLVLVFILTLIYGYYIEPKFLKINEQYIIDKKIDENHHGLKIVHLSDLYYGNSINIKEINKIIKEINKINPHILFFTGNLIADNVELTEKELLAFKKSWNKLDVQINSYYIESDRDDNPYFKEVIDNLNMINVTNTKKEFYYKSNKPINIVGVKNKVSKDLFDDLNSYTILLSNKPDLIDKVKKEKVNLMLSGNTLGGIVRLPYIGPLYKSKGSTKYFSDYYKVDQTKLYVSSGLGTNKLKVRIFNPPSFNFYRIYKK